MEFSVRPFSTQDIVDHDVWKSMSDLNIRLCSSSVQLPFFTPGLRILTHHSQHCFPHHPHKNLEHSVHFVGPCFLTQFSSIWFSSSVQLPFLADLYEFLNFCMHCFGVLFGKSLAIVSHSSPYRLTRAIRSLYSCMLHPRDFFFFFSFLVLLGSSCSVSLE